jgi:parvulin-like peptidyl-prolyl isomerase
MKNYFRAPLLIIGMLLGGLPLSTAYAAEPDDVIARVGDEIITFNSLDVTINSSAMVGIPIPKPGTRERTNMRLTLLDRRISSSLLYLDALARKVDGNPVFQSDVERYSDTILAMMYKQKYLVGELPVSDEEIREHFKKYYDDDTPFTQDIHMSIEAVLRKQQFKDKLATLRERLRKGVEVQAFEDKLDAGGDTDRKSSEVVATAGDESITWGQVRQKLTMAGQDNSPAARRERLENFIDSRIMVQKARAADLEQDAGYQRRLKEFRKSSLVNIHRARLAEEMSPTDDEIRDYYRQNRDQIVVHELRKVQMVVMKTEDEAAEVKQKIESGEITFFQAASEYSIDPNAKMNLGELGWVPQGTGFPELDKVTFALNPNEIGGPVESPAGWHLVKVLDVRDGDFQDIEDRDTWKKTRRLLVKEKENRYVAGLRKTNFSVEVYDDVFSRLTQKEVDALKASQQSAATGNGDT